MATDARALRTHEATHLDWETVKGWVKATFTKERMRETAFCVASVAFSGVLVSSLHRAMENYIILGF